MRWLRGLEIVAKGRQIERVSDSRYAVQSQHGDGTYMVERKACGWLCDCPDYSKREDRCKHIFAVLFLLSLPEIFQENSIEPPDYSANPVLNNGAENS